MGFKLQQGRLIGLFSVFLSSLFFYLSTVPIAFSLELSLSAPDFTFSRFLLGALVFGPAFIFKITNLRDSPWQLLLYRGLGNYAAVWCFFRAVQTGDPGLANTLNLTYPVFGVGLAMILRDEGGLAKKAAFSLMALAGIVLVLGPNFANSRIEPCVYGLLSGIFASAAIKSLHYSRGAFDTSIVLGAMFIFGLLCCLLVDGVPKFSEQSSSQIQLLLFSALPGVLAQYLLTYGAKSITSVEVGIISTSRVLIALICGYLFALDQPLGIAGWLGAVLIFGANVGLTTTGKTEVKGPSPAA